MQQGSGEDNSKPAKKPYKKPSFRFEKMFETMALSCGKTRDSTQQQCKTNTKNS